MAWGARHGAARRFYRREGSYKLARLAAKFGSKIPFDYLLNSLALDYRWRPAPASGSRASMRLKCGAYFPDLGSPKPSNLAPGMVRLRVVSGAAGWALDQSGSPIQPLLLTDVPAPLREPLLPSPVRP